MPSASFAAPPTHDVREGGAPIRSRNSYAELAKRKGCENGNGERWRYSQDQPFFVTVIDISGYTVTLDANYPLAGKDLNFDIELLEIV
jgi:FKBP-type peptidyl-prolyl cis-trans isomerase 2